MSTVPFALRPGEAGTMHLHEPESSSISSPDLLSLIIGLISLGFSPVNPAISIASAAVLVCSFHSVWCRKGELRIFSAQFSSACFDSVGISTVSWQSKNGSSISISAISISVASWQSKNSSLSS